MRLILGPFADLEARWLAEVQKSLRADPWKAQLVLSPSWPMLEYLQERLAGRTGAALHVHFMTFHHLALRLWREADYEPYGTYAADREILEELLRRVVQACGPYRREQDEDGPLHVLARSRGGISALLGTLREMEEARLEPGLLRQALREGFGASRPGEPLLPDPWLPTLSELFERYRCERARLQLLDRAELLAGVCDQVADSEFLRRFERLWLYGFYDLTQCLIDLVEELRRHTDAVLFYPLRFQPDDPGKAHPGYLFARSFHDRYLQNWSPRETIPPSARTALSPALHALFDPAARTAPTPGPLRIVHTSGTVDTAAACAKQVRSWIQDDGLPPHEIAVTARSLETSLPPLLAAFRENEIPLCGRVPHHGSAHPVLQRIRRLLALFDTGFSRSEVMELLHEGALRLPEDLIPQPRLWEQLTRQHVVTSEDSSWDRIGKELESRKSAGRQDESGERAPIPRDAYESLWKVVECLRQWRRELPQEASWSESAEAHAAVVESALRKPEGETEQDLFEKALGVIRGLARMERLDGEKPVPRETFLELLTRALDHLSFSPLPPQGAGVRLLNLMTMRGMSFRAVYLLELNEQVFPRTVREDAFLPDSARRSLADVSTMVLGAKLPQKQEGLEEEKLLFMLAMEAARERLVVAYQRSDDDGKPLIPSSFLDVLRSATGLRAELRIPRRWSDKFKLSRELPLFRVRLRTPREEYWAQTWAGADPREALEVLPAASNLRLANRSLDLIENSWDRPVAFDGMLPSAAGIRKALSPTALRDYATCPFRFLAARLLRLETYLQPEQVEEPAALDRGTILHHALERVYSETTREGELPELEKALDLAKESFELWEKEKPVGYPLLWEIHRREMLELLETVLQADLRELRESGFRPFLLEEQAHAEMGLGGGKKVRLRGQLDRIDVRDAEPRQFRVVDYKYTNRASIGSLNKALASARAIQLPAYLLLAKKLVPGAEPATAAFYWFGPRLASFNPARNRLAAGPRFWKGPVGRFIRKRIEAYASGITRGRFPIRTNEYCDRCDYRRVCRRWHRPTRTRTATTALVKRLDELAAESAPI